MWHLLRLISVRHLVGAPLRSALTVIGVVVGVTTVVGVTAINRAVMAAFRSTVETIAGKADLSIARTEAGFDDAYVDRVKKVPGVLHASGSLTAIAPVEGRLIDNAFSVTYAMELVAVVLALLGVINTLLAAVIDQTREIGLLRAIGATRSDVMRLRIAEAGFIGISGSLIGILAGIGMGLIITRVVGVQATGWSLPYVFPAKLALQMLFAASASAVLAGFYPANRAARLRAVEALAYE